MGQISDTAIVDSEGEFFHEEGLTFEDLAYGDHFEVDGRHYRKLTLNTVMRSDIGSDFGEFGTFLPSQPVSRYGDFVPFSPGLYVIHQPVNRNGSSFIPTLNLLPIGEIFTLDDPKVFYRKLTPTQAVRLNPSSPLLKKALNSGSDA